MADDRFAVVIFDPEGFWNYAAKDLPAKIAVDQAKKWVDMAAEHYGTKIDRVLITDAEDFTVFLWQRGKGVVFPPREEANHDPVHRGD